LCSGFCHTCFAKAALNKAFRGMGEGDTPGDNTSES
jgi:hypothetical protein